mmetsp:Transcript_21397/g.46854  ORF Transcript_21397/g.46854 Transcript_21397/m.46854 type:complete len:228 (+) Transcript_21397:826-1509(+)
MVHADQALGKHVGQQVRPFRCHVVGHPAVVEMVAGVLLVVELHTGDRLDVEGPGTGDQLPHGQGKGSSPGVQVQHVGHGACCRLRENGHQLLHVGQLLLRDVPTTSLWSLQGEVGRDAAGHVEAPEGGLCGLGFGAGRVGDGGRGRLLHGGLLVHSQVLGAAGLEVRPAHGVGPVLHLVSEVMVVPYCRIQYKVAPGLEHSVHLQEPGPDAGRRDPVPAPLARHHVK